jgi:sarcosine oxidase
MGSSMKIAVVGIGGTGSAAARHLARAGHQVVGFEQFAIGHDRGSSHGHSRIIRYTYPDLLYTQMMGDAYPLWAELEEEAGEELFVRCGGLYLGPRAHPEIGATEQSLRQAGLEYSVLSAEALRERFPAFRLQSGEVALWQRDSGFLRADRCVLANARLARAYGAVLREQTPGWGNYSHSLACHLTSHASKSNISASLAIRSVSCPVTFPSGSTPRHITMGFP